MTFSTAAITRHLRRLSPRVTSRTISTTTTSTVATTTPSSANLTALPYCKNEVRSMATAAAATQTSASAGSTLQELAMEHPYVDVVRYEHKNEKMTLQLVNKYADALAVGFLDTGLRPGDKVLSWLPLHFSEQHILQFACSKAGMTLYHLDPAIAQSSTEDAKAALSAALELTEANVLMTQEAGQDVNYVNIVEQVVPEVLIFNWSDGMPFITPRFPHLRFPIHTGFEYAGKDGMVPLYDMLCSTGESEKLLDGEVVDGKTPLLGELVVDAKGIPVKLGKTMGSDEIIAGNVWPEFTSILKKEYVEVEGVGNVF